MKHIAAFGFFDDHFLEEKLSKLGNPLEKLDKFINWKVFESAINEPFIKSDLAKSKGGRYPSDEAHISVSGILG